MRADRVDGQPEFGGGGPVGVALGNQRGHAALGGFKGVALEDSYALDIEAHPGTLVLRLDLLLLPGHPAWELPKPGERACFKTATLSFSKVRSLHWEGMGTRPSPETTLAEIRTA